MWFGGMDLPGGCFPMMQTDHHFINRTPFKFSDPVEHHTVSFLVVRAPLRLIISSFHLIPSTPLCAWPRPMKWYSFVRRDVGVRYGSI